MAGRLPLQFGPDSDDSAFKVFKTLFGLFVVVGLLRTFTVRTALNVSNSIRPIPDPTRVGTAVYLVVGLSVLAVGVTLFQQGRSPAERLERGTLFRFAGGAVIALVALAYAVNLRANLPVFPRELLIQTVNGLVVMGLASGGYARLRGFSLPLSLPDRTHWPAVFGTVLFSALTATGGTYLYMKTAETLPRFRYDREGMAGVWPVELVLATVFLGFGTGLLFNGAVQTELRDRLTGTHAAIAVTALVGFPLVVSPTLGGSSGTVGPVTLTAILAVDNFLLVAVALFLVHAVWVLSRRVGFEMTPVRGALAVVLVTSVVSLAIEDPPLVPLTVSRALVAAVVAVEFERSRSVWVPVAAYSSYQIFATMEAVRLLLAPTV